MNATDGMVKGPPTEAGWYRIVTKYHSRVWGHFDEDGLCYDDEGNQRRTIDEDAIVLHAPLHPEWLPAKELGKFVGKAIWFKNVNSVEREEDVCGVVELVDGPKLILEDGRVYCHQYIRRFCPIQLPTSPAPPESQWGQVAKKVVEFVSDDQGTQFLSSKTAKVAEMINEVIAPIVEERDRLKQENERLKTLALDRWRTIDFLQSRVEQLLAERSSQPPEQASSEGKISKTFRCKLKATGEIFDAIRWSSGEFSIRCRPGGCWKDNETGFLKDFDYVPAEQAAPKSVAAINAEAKASEECPVCGVKWVKDESRVTCPTCGFRIASAHSQSSDTGQGKVPWWESNPYLKESISVEANRRGGEPCLVGTRVTVAQIVAQISEGDSVESLAKDMDLDAESIKKLLGGISIMLRSPQSVLKQTTAAVEEADVSNLPPPWHPAARKIAEKPEVLAELERRIDAAKQAVEEAAMPEPRRFRCKSKYNAETFHGIEMGGEFSLYHGSRQGALAHKIWDSMSYFDKHYTDLEYLPAQSKVFRVRCKKTGEVFYVHNEAEYFRVMKTERTCSQEFLNKWFTRIDELNTQGDQ